MRGDRNGRRLVHILEVRYDADVVDAAILIRSSLYSLGESDDSQFTGAFLHRFAFFDQRASQSYNGDTHTDNAHFFCHNKVALPRASKTILNGLSIEVQCRGG